MDNKREVKLSGQDLVVVTEKRDTKVSDSSFPELYPETVKNYGDKNLQDLFNKTTKSSIASIRAILGNH